MKRFPHITVLLTAAPLLFAGCKLVSGEDDTGPVFQATLAGEGWRGDASGYTETDGGLRVRGRQGDVASGNYEQIWLSIPDFAGEGEYRLQAERAGYSHVIGGDAIMTFGYAQGGPDDVVTVTHYDAEEGTVRGTFRFDAVALGSFDGIERDDPFEVTGRFDVHLSPAP